MSDDAYVRIYDNTFLGGGRVWVAATNGTHKVVPADAIVIEAGRVPRVRASNIKGGVVDFGGLTYTLDPGIAQSEAMRWLAVAEYLRAHPPVNEAEVQRIAAALLSTRKEYDGKPVEVAYQETARRLYLAGVRAPEVTE